MLWSGRNWETGNREGQHQSCCQHHPKKQPAPASSPWLCGVQGLKAFLAVRRLWVTGPSSGQSLLSAVSSIPNYSREQTKECVHISKHKLTQMYPSRQGHANTPVRVHKSMSACSHIHVPEYFFFSSGMAPLPTRVPLVSLIW